jgi:hypothetical protein
MKTQLRIYNIYVRNKEPFVAKVAHFPVRASSTSSALIAARRAGEKLCLRLGRGPRGGRAVKDRIVWLYDAPLNELHHFEIVL